MGERTECTRVTRAHGRVNLIGAHTDYNGGWVLPTAIPQFAQVTLTPRSDRTVLARSVARGRPPRAATYVVGEEKRTGTWIDYLQGVTQVLAAAGHPLCGFEVAMTSTVPEERGLSSSAAIQIALLKALREVFGLHLEDVELARIGQRAENDFVGARIGITDQMACCFAQAGEALFLDTKTLAFERVPIPTDEIEFVVVNSGVSHELSAKGEGYEQRRAQCEEACELLSIGQLREFTSSELDLLKVLPDVLRRRARHVITENERVHQAVAALTAGDFALLGELFYASHASMRDDYEVSVPEVDRLVELFRRESAVYGARLTGGGFGGSVVAIVRKGKGAKVAHAVLDVYASETRGKGAILVP